VDRAQAESARLTAVALNPKVDAKVVALDAATPAPAAVAMPLPAAVTVASAKAVPPTKPEPTKPEPIKPEAAKPAATRPAPAAGTGYAVQVGAFADAAAATSLRDKLRAAGFNAFTDAVQTESGKRTRVRVGPAMTRAEADALKAQVKARAQIDGIVRPHP
jgi:cell division septation protein DedD